MNGNDFEWDIDNDYFDSWCVDEDSEFRMKENVISNDDFLIHHTNEIEFRTYIIRELNRINSFLSNNYEVARQRYFYPKIQQEVTSYDDG